MYTVEDELFQRTRSLVASLSGELSAQRDGGVRRPVDLRDLVRGAELFPRRRRARSS
jgi:hypothetical protein